MSSPVRAAILAMETNILMVERIGRLLMYLGERDGEIETDALNALCDANYDCRLTTIGMAGST